MSGERVLCTLTLPFIPANMAEEEVAKLVARHDIGICKASFAGYDAPQSVPSGHDNGMCKASFAGDDAPHSVPAGHDGGMCKAGSLGDDAVGSGMCKTGSPSEMPSVRGCSSSAAALPLSALQSSRSDPAIRSYSRTTRCHSGSLSTYSASEPALFNFGCMIRFGGAICLPLSVGRYSASICRSASRPSRLTFSMIKRRNLFLMQPTVTEWSMR